MRYRRFKSNEIATRDNISVYSELSHLALHVRESATRKIHQRISIQHASRIFIPTSRILHQVLTHFWSKRLRSLLCTEKQARAVAHISILNVHIQQKLRSTHVSKWSQSPAHVSSDFRCYAHFTSLTGRSLFWSSRYSAIMAVEFAMFCRVRKILTHCPHIVAELIVSAINKRWVEDTLCTRGKLFYRPQ